MKIRKVLPLALALLAVCYSSYSYSDTVYGQSGNATAEGYNWVMTNVIPQFTGLTVEGVKYKYTIEKDENSNATVVIRNENVDGTGYVYNREDNWDGLRGNTKVGYDPLPSILGTSIGDGEIFVRGEGTLSDVNISYAYKYDTCADPILNPECPGYADALYKYLLDNGLLNDLDNPYYNQFVQNVLNRKPELTEREPPEEIVEEETEEESLEDKLAVGGAAEELSNAAEQGAMLAALAATPTLSSYYTMNISGGIYEETIKLQDKEIPDNRRAMRSLASDEKHRTMVRSQYDK